MPSERRRRHPRRTLLRRLWLYTEVCFLFLLLVGLTAVGSAFYSVIRLLPSSADIASYEPTEATKIFSSDGVLLANVYEENREVVPIGDIPKDLQNATVAIEDERFYKHPGVDIQGIARAFYQNLKRGHLAQGGSTLTQQLARNIYLSREKSFSRKLKEILLAFELERNFSKEQILELYMNQVYYGSGAYGVQTAARVYFDKDVKDLTLSESALLAGLPQKPSSYSPYEDMDAAIKRRDVVLDHMAHLGYITSEQRDEAEKDQIHLAGLRPQGLGQYKAPWFVTYIIKELTNKYGADLVYRGGLRVHTTLNYEMQHTAEEALRNGVKDAKWRRVSQGALICIDPSTGYIKAMVGGVNPDFTKDQFNRVTQAHRQPGSSFKAFVYTAAVDEGYDPNYRISNERITFKGYGSEGWSPQNYDGRYGGMLTMRQAIARSVNICAVRMADQIGINKVITYARLLGIKSDLQPNLSLALGSAVVTPLEMCSAYGVFAAKGMRAEPLSIVRINESDRNNDGAVIDENRPIVHQVLSEQTAEIMDSLFRGVVTMGTGRAASRVPDARGKTGTTQDDRDAWFVGYTPELATVVWVGNDNYSPMRSVWGGNVCAPTWATFMLKALQVHKDEHDQDKEAQQANQQRSSDGKTTDNKKTTKLDNSTPGHEKITVTICAQSGLLATRYCPVTYRVTYDMGKQPMTYCNIHGPQSNTNSSPNGNANQNTPQPATTPETDQPNGTTDNGPQRPGGTASQPQYLNVTICVDSGQVANEYCPETVTRRYLAGEAPSRVCRIHKAPE